MGRDLHSDAWVLERLLRRRQARDNHRLDSGSGLYRCLQSVLKGDTDD